MAFARDLPGGFALSDDQARLDLALVHRYLAEESYWALGRDRAAFERAVAHSLCLGLYAPDGTQIGFARAMTDYGLRAHLLDVFVLPAWRGHGLGRALVGAMLEHPALSGVATWTLSTRDAHGLYASFGFAPQPDPQKQMVLQRPRKG